MRFAIIDGLPYLISQGMAIPVKIEGEKVTANREQAFNSGESGRYCLQEIKAKCSALDSIKSTSRRRKKASSVEAAEE